MWEFDEKDIPIISTRRALLILDVQNDFLADDSVLPVRSPSGFVDRLKELVPSFRPNGYVFWIQTLFQESRSINTGHVDAEKVVTDRQVETGKKTYRSPAARERAEFHLGNDEGGEEAYLTIQEGDAPTILTSSPGTDLYREVVEYAPPDVWRDVHIQKSTYSAFRDGTLVQSLRGKFVTEIYLCGVLTNMSVFATAQEAAQHGYAITLVEDCLGYVDKARHDEALRRLVQTTGCDVLTSQEVLESFKNDQPRRSRAAAASAEKGKVKDPKETGIEDAMANFKISHGPLESETMDTSAATDTDDGAAEQSETASDVLRIIRAGRTNHGPTSEDVPRRDRVPSKAKTRRRPSGSKEPRTTSKSKATMEASTESQESKGRVKDEASQACTHASSPKVQRDNTASPDPSVGAQKPASQQPVDVICEGDSAIYYDIIPEPHQARLFSKLRDEIYWQNMSHQGGEVPRLVCVQADDLKGATPIYRHPSDESPPSAAFTPTVKLIQGFVEQLLGHSVNHVLIQLYRNGSDYISEHSDKTLDIAPGSYIANVSLGAQRTMVFRTKRDAKSPSSQDEDTDNTRRVCRVKLPHNSMCKVGLGTNKKWMHSIRQDKRASSERSEAERAYGGMRISLTFRKIGTFLNQSEHTIWGQGATSKEPGKAKTVLIGDPEASRQLLQAFGNENQSSDFDWEAVYGRGFDVLHLSNTRKLYLSNNSLSNLKVQLALAEYEVQWTPGQLSVPFKWSSLESTKTPPNTLSSSPIKLIDNDPARTVVIGDVAILLYIDALYTGTTPSIRSPTDIAQIYTRFQRAIGLLDIWSAKPFNMQALKNETFAWTHYATQSEFMGGDKISIVDFVFFPTCIEMSKTWDAGDGFDALARYWQTMMTRKCVTDVLGPYDAAAWTPKPHGEQDIVLNMSRRASEADLDTRM